MNMKRNKILLILSIFFFLFTGEVNTMSCSGRTLCKDVINCKQALFELVVCGYQKSDADRDGVPCESVCGRTLTPVLKAMKNELRQKKRGILQGFIGMSPQTLKCGVKKYCREMLSCKEAIFYMKKCGLKYLDGNNDGRPCNHLCK